MINSNLVFAQEFYDTFVEPFYQQMLKNWSAELQGPDSSRVQTLLSRTSDFEIEYRIKTKKLKKLNIEQQIYFYIFIRMMLIQHPNDALCSLILEDFTNWFIKIYQKQILLFEIIRNYSDNQLIYHMDEILWNQKNKRHLFRILYSKISVNNTEKWTLFDYLRSSDCLPLPVLIKKPKPRQKVWHKGYRDHGSLGSDFSKLLKEQSRTKEYQNIIEQEEKKKQDPIDFLSGFLNVRGPEEGDS